MTKATKALPTTSTTINRRAMMGGGSLAAAAIAAPATPHALPPAAAPSSAGRRILKLVAEQRALHTVWDANEDVASARHNELFSTIEAISKSITARPITSMADIIDRPILAAWACQPHCGRLISDDIEGLRGAYIVDVLALASIRPEQCNADFA